MKNISVLQIANIVALIGVLVMNFLSQTAGTMGLELFPNTVAELGESRAIFFLPAGYVFAIWGVIYTGMIAFIIYQARPSMRDSEVVKRVGWWFVLSSIANATWLVLFLNNLLFASTIVIALLLVSLLAIYVRLGIGRGDVSTGRRWAVHIPFSIYLGWVAVATVANISAWLYVDATAVTAWLGINSDIWAVVMMAIAGVLAVAMLITRGDIAYALVAVWALVGIYNRPFDTEVFAIVSELNADLVNGGALAVAGIIAVGVVLQIVMKRLRPANTQTQAPAMG
jgi:benzodiazapine receptor